MSELVSTGVAGLDSILTGGITERSTVLVSGNPGTGKSIFGIQYLYHGAPNTTNSGVLRLLRGGRGGHPGARPTRSASRGSANSSTTATS